MDRAVWNGEEITIEEVIDDFEIEKAIKLASRKSEIYCPDKGCSKNILEYCHGSVRVPYFRHKEDSKCNYAKYDNESSKYREILHKLYRHFKSEYKVLLDQNLIIDHYTPMLLELPNHELAIEFLDDHFNIEKTEDLNKKYRESGVNVSWIVKSKMEFKSIEKDYSFLKRFAMRLSDVEEIIVINSYDDVRQYKWDKEEHVYSSEVKSINDLIIRNNRIQIHQFEEEYALWKNKLNNADTITKTTKSTNTINVDPIKHSPYSNINSYDINNETVFYCNLCKQILSMDDCVGYSLPKTDNVLHGVCRNCLEK